MSSTGDDQLEEFEGDESKLVRRVLWDFGAARFYALARRVRSRIQRITPSGAFGGNPQNLWDEFCFDQQNGPAAALEIAWDQILDLQVASVVADLVEHEALLLTIVAAWEGNGVLLVDGRNGLAIALDEIERQVRGECCRLALDKNLSRLGF